MANTQNLRPLPKGVSGNPGGRPKKKLIASELEQLLEQEAPRGNGKTYAAVIAEALVALWASSLVDASTMAYPIVMTGVAVASWALRPPSRRLGPRVSYS